MVSFSETAAGGTKEAIFEISGQGAFSRLKYESGGHRVQRVPVTESSGRLHTSMATVAVMPEVEDVDIEINDVGSAHRRLPFHRPRRPEREHDRLRGADHASADRDGRHLPGREVAAQE